MSSLLALLFALLAAGSRVGANVGTAAHSAVVSVVDGSVNGAEAGLTVDIEPAETAPAVRTEPAVCPELTAEDGSCVSASFYDAAPILTLTPCEHEDSAGCVWDAAARGNGLGGSFYAPVDGSAVVFCSTTVECAEAQSADETSGQ